MKMNLRNLASLAVMAAALSMTGCNLEQTATLPVDGSALNGRVMGGQQPVGFSTLQLYAAGSAGYGTGAVYSTGTSLLGTNVVQTDVSGNFGITGDYTCPSASTEVYLVATGGNPGGGTNANIAMMAALGPCGNLSSSTFIVMNEVTTVASVWALAPFMTGIANVGTSATNVTGLTNAFATVNKLVNVSIGQMPGVALPAGATLPVAKINSIADVLAACINSTGGTHGDGSACGTLFANTVAGGVFPSDTITAAMNMAKNPGTNVATLSTLATATSPFQPTASMTDFALVVTHTGGGLANPKGIAVNAAGEVWTANTGNNSVTRLNNLGAALSGSGGILTGPLSSPNAVAIDGNGNPWFTNANNSVVKMNSTGSSATVYSGTNFNLPASIAVDASGNAWVANSGDSSLTEISSGGVQTRYTGGSLNTPAAVVVQPK